MNNKMVVEQSQHFAERLLKEAPADPAGRTRWAFRAPCSATLGRRNRPRH